MAVSRPFKVVVTDFLTEPLDAERSVLGDLAEVVACNAYSEAELAGWVEDAHALMVYHNVAISTATIERLRHCKLIVRCGVGYDNVDRSAAAARGIPVANVPDYGTEEVADTALGMLLALARGIHLYNSRLRFARGPWMYTLAVPLRRLRGQRLGIVGLGRIGTAMALRVKALGMDVQFFDPYKPDGYDKALGVRRVETLDELLADSLAISLHCPLTDETRHMIDRRALETMPPGSYLINTARGAVVDTRALVDALASGRLAGAGIDVLEAEPPPDDHPLVVAWRDPGHPAHDRLILNPHAAFYCEEGLLDMRIKGAQACRRALLGQPLRNLV